MSERVSGPVSPAIGRQSRGRVRFSARRLLALSAYWLAINYLWQGMGALVLPRLIVGLVAPGERGTALAVLSASGALLAILVQPAAGAFSDGTRVRWGRRKPYMVGGTLAALGCLAGLAVAGSYAALVIPYCALQAASNTAEGAYQGLLPDQVPAADRGRAAGYYGITVLVGAAVGFLLTGQLIAAGHIPLALASMGVVLVVTLGITLRWVPDTPAAAPLRSRREALLGLFSFRPRAHPNFSWLLLSRLLALMGTTGLTSFAYLYLKDVFFPGGGAAIANRAAGATSLLLAVIVACAVVVALPAARLSQRVGRRAVVAGAAWTGALGTLLIIPAPSLVWVYGVGLLVGAANGALLSVDWALVADLVPPDQAGRFMGISNLATAGSGIIGVSIAGPLLDAVNRVAPNAGFTAIFGLFAACFLAGGALVWRVRVPGPVVGPTGPE